MASFPAEQPSAAPAFERLYRRHVGEVYRYASAMLRNPADAEDVVQTTFLNAFRAFEQGQRPQRPLSWLMAIAHNVCRQRFRQQSSRPSEVALDDDLAMPAGEEEAIRAEDIRRALSQLGFNQRTALVMRELEGRSYAEVAQRLELSHSAVETLVFRARRALREQLEGMLTCSEAGRAVSRQLDGLLTRQERGALRAHLRSCSDCRALARRMRGQRSAIRALGVLPLPASLAGFSASGSGMVAGVAARAFLLKLAGAAAAMLVAAGAGYETAHTLAPPDARTPSGAKSSNATVMQARTPAAPSSQLAPAAEGSRRPHIATIAHARIPAPRAVTTEASSAAATPVRTRAEHAPPAGGSRHPSSSHGRPAARAMQGGRPQRPSSSHGRPADPPAESPAPVQQGAAHNPPSPAAASCRQSDAGGLVTSTIETAPPGCSSQAASVHQAMETPLQGASVHPTPTSLGSK
ncbi:MAG TPA: sigma-70 family RNA polymerase sigma factor [Gaiellaceae bacterium]|nr:sigma-70 family RNA polymerase sigma factor [Gaiellaceae bacterium]